MRYIGSKNELLDDIIGEIKQIKDTGKIIDIFGGTGVVSSAFKKSNYKVISNDALYFSYCLMRGSVGINKNLSFSALGFDPIEYLNNLNDSNFKKDELFIYTNYSPNKTSDRMYFTNENASKIDVIRLTIEKWKTENLIDEDEYYYLLCSLLNAVPFVANITGVYSAYLKEWDKRAFKEIKLEKHEIIKKRQCKVYNLDYIDLLKKVKGDILYSDSPYNERQYLPNYHILETIAKYDYPSIHGKTGMRDYDNSETSPFCRKKDALSAFENMITNADVESIVISYNNEGIVKTEDMVKLCQKYAKPNTFKLTEIPYRRYKSKIPNNRDGLKEQIYSFKKV